MAPRRPTDMVGGSTASSWPSDDDPMEVTVPGPDPDPEIRKNRMKNRIFHFWHVVSQIEGLGKPVWNLAA